MALVKTAPPTTTPITLAEAKAHLRVDFSDDDDLITGLIKAATEAMEQKTRLRLITQTWDYIVDAWPDESVLRLPLAPVQSVSSVQYVDTDGNTQTIAATDYIVDTDSVPARVTPAYGKVWPVAREQVNAITVRFVVGFGDAETNVPEDLRRALLLLVGHWYENREAVVLGGTPAEVPMAMNWMTLPRKVWL